MSDFTKEFSARLRAAGVVGAGGAGFPAYIKAGAEAECVIVNAAECEPLLKKDQVLLERCPEKMFEGLELVMRATGAARGVVGIKKKHEKTIQRLEELARTRKNVSVFPLGDYYPAGDEQCLVYDVTGRVTPMGGIPLDTGCVVFNVETLCNAADAGRTPVVEKYITVTGAVKRPCTIKVPVGISYAEAVEIAGGLKIGNAAGIDGGPMMGKVITDFSGVTVNRSSGGLVVLPKDHPLIVKKAMGRPAFSRIGRSACDQCSFCTELCPRYLLGHNIQPHRAMRSLLFSGGGGKLHSEYALLCCECSLCSLYSCPENLSPRDVCAAAKSDLRGMKVGFRNSALSSSAPAVHPVREERKVPVSKLVRRLGLTDYNVAAPYFDHDHRPARVRIQLSQHIGTPCRPVVVPGQSVKKGEIVGDLPADKTGCPVHASITGKISKVNDFYVEIES